MGCAVRPAQAVVSSGSATSRRRLRLVSPAAARAPLGAGLCGAAAVLLSPPALALDAPAQFARSCAGCHVAGGNVVDARKTLRAPDLEANGVAEKDALAKLVYYGKGKMPGYGEGCAPAGRCTFAARLSDAEIDALAAYVLEQAAAGWPAPAAAQ